MPVDTNTFNFPPHLSRVEKAELYWGWKGCVVPGCKGKVILHHIIPKEKGGTNGLHNLLPICNYHERLIHAAGSYMKKLSEGKTGLYLLSKQKRRKMKLKKLDPQPDGPPVNQ